MKKATAPAPVLEKPVNLKRYYYILGILVFFIFANTLSNGYNLDDELVTRSHKLTSRGLEATGDIFTSPYYSDAMGYAYGYRPMVHFSFALEHQLFGEKPGVSHFFNLVLYVLSVVFFFKLILKWTGEKGLTFAIVCIALFAVHPVHTEVVASIKNRDEILAFLFVILAGLSLEKYLDKGKWLSLLWIFLFFSCAMLSKKSVLPMAFLLPAIAVFVKNISLKQLVIVSVLLLIPAALVGAELKPFRMATIGILGAAFIAFAYFIRAVDFKALDWKKVLTDYRLIFVISLLVFGYSILVYNVLFYVLSVLIIAAFYNSNRAVLSVLLVAQGLIAYYFFGSTDIMYFTVSFSIFIVSEGLFAKQVRWAHLVLLLAGAAWMCCYFPMLINLVLSIAVIVLARFRWYIGLAGAVAALLLTMDFSMAKLFPLLIAALMSVHAFWKKMDLHRFILVAGMALFAALNYPSFHSMIPAVAQVERPLAAVAKKDKAGQSFLQEGRNLEMVENTLVLPHTQAETAATGMSTLGEYMRLMVFPYELSFYYGYAKTRTVGFNDPWVWVSVIVHLALIFLACWQVRKRPLLSIGIVWYLLCILLFSNWVELVAGMVGERLAFTASAGFCLLVASVFAWIRPELSFRKPGAAEFVLLAAVLFFTGRTIVRNSDWKDPLTLMGRDIRHLDNSAQANNLYALNLMRSSIEDPGQTREMQLEKQQLAVQHFDKALQIWPSFFNAAYDKGRAAMVLQDTLGAIQGFAQAVRIGNADLPELYYQLGDLYLRQKKNKEFLAVAKQIYAMHGDKSDSYSVLARGYFVNGYKDSSIAVLNEGIQKFPADQNLKMNLKMVGETQP